MSVAEQAPAPLEIEALNNSTSGQVAEATANDSLRPKRKLLRKAIATVAIAGSLTAAAYPEDAYLYAGLASKNISALGRDINPFEQAPDPETFEYMEHTYGVGNGLYTEHRYGGYAPIWSHSQVVSAYRLASLDDAQSKYKPKYQRALDATNYYWQDGEQAEPSGYDAHIRPPFAEHFSDSERFVDDNLWVGLLLAKEYEASDNPEALNKAQNIFDLAIDQWDHGRGGIYWQVQRPSVRDNTRAIVSNAPAVQLGVKLYQITGEEDYLTKSEQIFDWIKQLKDTDQRLYNDHMRLDGTYEPSKWSYVQGTVLGAMAALSQVHPEKYPLDYTVELAEDMLANFQEGRMMNSPEFDAIFYENLLWVAALNNQPDFTYSVRESLSQTVQKLPAKQKDLISTAGALKLRTLHEMSEESYRHIL